MTSVGKSQQKPVTKPPKEPTLRRDSVTNYTVKYGDNPGTIANKFNISAWEAEKYIKGLTNTLHEGQVLTVSIPTKANQETFDRQMAKYNQDLENYVLGTQDTTTQANQTPAKQTKKQSGLEYWLDFFFSSKTLSF